jgi:hypothetical protein
VERQYFVVAPGKPQSSLALKCSLSTVNCPTTFICFLRKALTLSIPKFGWRVVCGYGVISATTLFFCNWLYSGSPRLGMIRKRLAGKRCVETDANVIVEGIGRGQLAVAGLNIRRLPRGRIARVFRETKVGNHRIEIALPQGRRTDWQSSRGSTK